MSERETLAAALYEAGTRGALQYASMVEQAKYLCLADVAIETLDALRKPPAPEPEPGENGLVDPELPGFDFTPSSWNDKMGL